MTSTTLASTMQAWQQNSYGGPDQVERADIPVPTPGRGEVLLRVRATGLNAADIHVMRGDPMLLRAAFGLSRPRASVRGMDVAGTIVAVGSDAARWAVGDEVVVELPGGGGLGPYAVAPVKRLVLRPAEVTASAAATLPIAGGTAWQSLDRAGVTSGSRVLVIGASGGVGTFAVQLAALRGAEVWALCGERNHALVESLGAARAIDRSTPLGELDAESFDHVIDIVGSSTLGDLRRLVRPGGSVVMVSGMGGRVLGPMPRILGAALRSIGSRRPLRALAAVTKPEVLSELLRLTAEGSIRPVIEREFTFDQARDALAHVDASHTVGKVVVRAAP
ncbi:NAD(P)-dependent alcohol dehydrogenase [Salinibacterium hongtaonis]|uniref:NAD(P)-dependent alcohol dehydrogenase n=1 Tax=Homoserinimonas hongtaonis TaxID=2079791 RepID=A0A2U1T1P0_9MICO|nr:NAD(P)-dependent alcohol dehydrogenase [Salinibacterium hongtaonis]PWB97785.1 NAD(P)-dependent alcohol dehydrogenase [Salinibacterium hongtaonis]